MLPALKHELRIACFCWEVCRWDTTAAEREMPWTQFTRMWCCSELRAWWMKSKIPRCNQVARRTRPLSLKVEPTKYIHKNNTYLVSCDVTCLLFAILQAWRMSRQSSTFSIGESSDRALATKKGMQSWLPICVCAFLSNLDIMFSSDILDMLTSRLHCFGHIVQQRHCPCPSKYFHPVYHPAQLSWAKCCFGSSSSVTAGHDQSITYEFDEESMTYARLKTVILCCVVSELLWHQLRRGQGTH